MIFVVNVGFNIFGFQQNRFCKFDFFFGRLGIRDGRCFFNDFIVVFAGFGSFRSFFLFGRNVFGVINDGFSQNIRFDFLFFGRGSGFGFRFGGFCA